MFCWRRTCCGLGDGKNKNFNTTSMKPPFLRLTRSWANSPCVDTPWRLCLAPSRITRTSKRSSAWLKIRPGMYVGGLCLLFPNSIVSRVCPGIFLCRKSTKKSLLILSCGLGPVFFAGAPQLTCVFCTFAAVLRVLDVCLWFPFQLY